LYLKPRWVVINKIDLIPPEERASRLEELSRQLLEATGAVGTVFAISAATGEGCPSLCQKVMQFLETQTPRTDTPVEDDADSNSDGASCED
jgi:GTP-binding protein